MGLFGFLKRKKKTPEDENKSEVISSAPGKVVKSSTSLPDVASGDFYISYEYKAVKFFPPYNIVSKVKQEYRSVGSDITLMLEPTNKYDDRAVALYINRYKIGYILRGTIQDMIHDYFAQNLPIKATLSSLDLIDGEYQGYINLIFYRPGPDPRRLGYQDIDIKAIKPTNQDMVANTPLTGKKVVFCGYFALPLQDIMQKAVDSGATLRAVVTKTVDYLIVGNNNDAFLDENGMSSKERTAAKLNAEGNNIQIIGEEEYLKIVGSAQT